MEEGENDAVDIEIKKHYEIKRQPGYFMISCYVPQTANRAMG